MNTSDTDVLMDLFLFSLLPGTTENRFRIKRKQSFFLIQLVDWSFCLAPSLPLASSAALETCPFEWFGFSYLLLAYSQPKLFATLLSLDEKN